MNSIRNRWFSRNLKSALKVLPVTVVTGARQTGKTTLVKMLGSKRGYFSLDDVGILDQAERNPDSLLTTRPVTLDEVERAPQLLLAVKCAVDEQRRAGDFVLTESANLLLMGQVADTLAGWAIYLEGPPSVRRNGCSVMGHWIQSTIFLRRISICATGPRRRAIGSVGCCAAVSRRRWLSKPTLPGMLL